MKKIKAFLTGIVLATAVSAVSHLLASSEITDSEQLLRDGVVAYESEDYELALQKFRQFVSNIKNTLSPDPGSILLLRIAACEYNTDRFENAEITLNSILSGEISRGEQESLEALILMVKVKLSREDSSGARRYLEKVKFQVKNLPESSEKDVYTKRIEEIESRISKRD